MRTYGWYIILNRFGVANDALLGLGLISDRIAFMPSTGAIIVGLAHALLPYTVLTIMGWLHGINPNLESAAMSLGAGRTAHVFPRGVAAEPARRGRRFPAGVLHRDQRVRDTGDPRRTGDAGPGDRDLRFHDAAPRLVARRGAGGHPDRELVVAALCRVADGRQPGGACEGAHQRRWRGDVSGPWALLRASSSSSMCSRWGRS